MRSKSAWYKYFTQLLTVLIFVPGTKFASLWFSILDLFDSARGLPWQSNISGRSWRRFWTQSSRSWFAKRPWPGEGVTWATPVSGTRITGGGSGYAAILADVGWVLYSMEFGSVTLKRIGFFVFQLNTQHTLPSPDGDSVHSDMFH
jgi:hypothetical protein